MSDWSDGGTTLEEMKGRLVAFNEARDWGQFHAPKDLAMCLSAEAGELLEPFLWKGPEDTVDLGRVREELADVVICALNLAGRLEIDLAAAVQDKIASNEARYPVDLARGRAVKYDVLAEESAGEG